MKSRLSVILLRAFRTFFVFSLKFRSFSSIKSNFWCHFGTKLKKKSILRKYFKQFVTGIIWLFVSSDNSFLMQSIIHLIQQSLLFRSGFVKHLKPIIFNNYINLLTLITNELRENTIELNVRPFTVNSQQNSIQFNWVSLKTPFILSFT